MADITKQKIATISLNQQSHFTFRFKENWNIAVEKIWGKNRILRRNFMLEDGGIFECSLKLGENIDKTVKQIFEEHKVNTSKIELIDISIMKNSNPQIFININKLPKLSKTEKIWVSIKRFF
jgi:hypothetical protein